MAPRPRLLVLASTYPRWTRDPEPAFVHELSRRLTARFDVTVLCPHAPGAGAIEMLDGVSVHRYRYAPAALETLVQDGGIVANLRRAPWKWLLVPLFLAGQAWTAVRLVRRLRPAVLHAHWIVPQGIVAALLSALLPAFPPFVITVHGGDLHTLNRGPLRGLKRWILARAAAVTVVSRAMVAAVEALGVPAAKISVLPMGADWAGRFTPDAATPRAAHELLFVGRLVPKKGVDLLLGALPQIRAAVPAARLTIAGFGPEEAALRARAAPLGDAVRFLGALPQDALPPLYRRAAVFVAPSVRDASGDQEGLPVAVMEALGCGCPVAVSDMPGIDDLLGADDRASRFAMGDPSALARTVVALLRDPAGARAAADRRRAALAQRVDWDGVAGSYARLLEATATS
jgi:glycosyltransferase involved in cell wall biosynthesis